MSVNDDFGASMALTSPTSQSIPFFFKGSLMSTRVSSADLQPTAIHGFDGVNSKCGRAPISVTRCALPSRLRNSNAAGIPPIPAPTTIT